VRCGSGVLRRRGDLRDHDFLYGGKTWCNFVCPVGLVEKIHTEPAKAAIGGGELTSQCAPCVACKKHCPDIDLEQGYWKEAAQTPRRVSYYAWPGGLGFTATTRSRTGPTVTKTGGWAYDARV
jgi:hypothetical protein